MTTASPLKWGVTIETTSTPLPADLAELYQRHYETVFRAALRVTGNPADAQDVLQTVFLRVLSRSEDGEFARSPPAYFRRAAVNAAIDLLRRRAVHAETVYDEAGSDRAGSGQAAYVDVAPHAGGEPPALLKERLRRAVATLEREDATLFLLRHVEGLELEELAAMFQLAKNTVAVRLHRIRLRLQTELER